MFPYLKDKNFKHPPHELYGEQYHDLIGDMEDLMAQGDIKKAFEQYPNIFPPDLKR